MKKTQQRPIPTPEQDAAIKHLAGPLLVLAGPGTGKTTVLALRILFLLECGIATNDKILAVTFTTKAAGEMRDRLLEYSLPEDKHPSIATLHAVAARILRENAGMVGLPNSFLVSDSNECKLALADACKRVARELKLEIESVRKVIPDLTRAWYKGLTVSQVEEPLRSLYRHYEELMLFYRATDFDGMLIQASTILRKNVEALKKYQEMAQFLLIDEYQDINEAQHQLLKLLAVNHRGVFAVGDDDQSIYSWRGGSPRLISGFGKSFPNASTVTLTICQRCPGHVLRGALSVIARNTRRLKKDLKPCGPDGERIRILVSKSENAEARWIADWIKEQVDGEIYLPSDITVLATDPTISEIAFRELLKRGVRAVRKAGSPLNSGPVRIIMSLIRLALDTADNLAARRGLEEGPVKGIGPKAIETILSAAQANGCTMWEILLSPKENGLPRWEEPIRKFVPHITELREMDKKDEVANIVKTLAESLNQSEDGNVEWLLKQAESVPKESGLGELVVRLRSKVSLDVTDEAPADEDKDAVNFLTTYLVKGLEAKVVFVIGLEEDLFPDPNKDIEEERCLFYVAMTRAKSELFLCTSKMRKVRGFQFYDPSPFIAEIPQGHITLIQNC